MTAYESPSPHFPGGDESSSLGNITHAFGVAAVCSNLSFLFRRVPNADPDRLVMMLLIAEGTSLLNNSGLEKLAFFFHSGQLPPLSTFCRPLLATGSKAEICGSSSKNYRGVAPESATTPIPAGVKKHWHCEQIRTAGLLSVPVLYHAAFGRMVESPPPLRLL